MKKYLIGKLTTRLLKKYEFIWPDFIIGENYLQRWWVVKNTLDNDSGKERVYRGHTRLSRFFNVYLHRVTESDDDTALHDHPWFNISIILRGSYVEVLQDCRKQRRAGDIVFRRASLAHRLEVADGPVWSLFITGPKWREWGFRCQKGWVHWKIFTNYDQDGAGSGVGRGCE